MVKPSRTTSSMPSAFRETTAASTNAESGGVSTMTKPYSLRTRCMNSWKRREARTSTGLGIPGSTSSR